MKLFSFSLCACAVMLLFSFNSLLASNVSGVTTAFDLVITEILADPDPSFGLPNAEYVEVYNRSGVPVDLSGWTFFDGSNRSLPGMVLMPGKYLIICANADTSMFGSYGMVAGVSSLSLTNGGEKIALISASGNVIDSVVYSIAWYHNSYKADGGWSLERIDNDFTCVDEGNWKPSENANGGTPGSANSVYGQYDDVIEPVLLRAYCPDSASVALVFSEKPYYNSGAFQLSDGLTVTAVIADPNRPFELQLNLSAELDSHKVYYVIVSGVTDCAGNLIRPPGKVKFGLPVSGMRSHLIINEILFNPNEGGVDFAELYNAGFETEDLSRFHFASLDVITGEIKSTESLSASTVLIFPGDYVVLTESSLLVISFYHTSYPYNFIQLDDLPSMNNDEGKVALILEGETIDEVYYNEDMHFELLENVKGISLERMDPLRSSKDVTNWHSASAKANYATPGLVNSVFMQSGSHTKEVDVVPEIFSPDQDGYDDVVTFSVKTDDVNSISGITLFNSSGQVIYRPTENILAGLEGSFSWDGIMDSGVVGAPGIYVALIEVFNLSGDVRYYKVPFVLAIKN